MIRLELPRHWLFPAVCLVITTYFIVHTIEGNHGLLRMHQVKEEIKLAEEVAAEMRADRELLEIKIRSLSAESLDIDQLKESALQILNLTEPEESIVLK